MKEGYKDSPVGMIPDDWDFKTMESISTIVRGASPRPKGDVRYYGGNIPRLMVQDVTRDGKYVTPKIDFLTEEGAQRSRFMKAGTLVMVCSGTVGIPSILKVDACVHDGFLAFPEISESCSPDFIYYTFCSLKDKFNSSATHGGVFTNLTTAIIKEFQIPIPTIKEQQKISSILSTIDEKIDAITDKITATQQLKNGLMQQLLTKGIGHTKFKDSPLGEIPESWEVVKFGEICYNITEKYLLPQGKCIDLEHIEQLTGRILGWDEISSKSSTKNRFKPNDILFGKLRPYLRKFWLSEFEGGCTSELLIFRAVNGFIPTFLFFHVQQDKFIQNAVGNSFGTKMPRTNWQTIANFQIALPSIREQKEISEVLSSIVEKLDVLQEKKSQYDQLKHGLMQQLLTGKIRVKLN
jgi:type I restriction enzyme S subunit